MNFERIYGSCSTTLWKEVFSIVNKHQWLTEKKLQVHFASDQALAPIVKRGLGLLSLQGPAGKRQSIDVIRVRADVPATFVADRVSKKVLQHLKAVSTPGILLSPFGRKLDLRLLGNSQIQMHENSGLITINKRNVRVDYPFSSCVLGFGDFCPFSSLTIVRAVEEKGIIRFFDDEVVETNADHILTVDTNSHDPEGTFVLRLAKIDDVQKKRFSGILKDLYRT